MVIEQVVRASRYRVIIVAAIYPCGPRQCAVIPDVLGEIKGHVAIDFFSGRRVMPSDFAFATVYANKRLYFLCCVYVQEHMLAQTTWECFHSAIVYVEIL